MMHNHYNVRVVPCGRWVVGVAVAPKVVMAVATAPTVVAAVMLVLVVLANPVFADRSGAWWSWVG
jgi:hypothetical protein